MEFEDGVVVQEVEQPLRPQGKSQNDLARFEVLARAGQHASLNQRNDSVRHQFAVHSQIFAVHQHGQHGVRNTAYTGLQHGSVLDQTCHVARDGHVQVGDLRFLHFTQWAR